MDWELLRLQRKRNLTIHISRENPLPKYFNMSLGNFHFSRKYYNFAGIIPIQTLVFQFGTEKHKEAPRNATWRIGRPTGLRTTVVLGAVTPGGWWYLHEDPNLQSPVLMKYWQFGCPGLSGNWCSFWLLIERPEGEGIGWYCPVYAGAEGDNWVIP